MMANLTLRGWSAGLLTAQPEKRAELIEYVGSRLANAVLKPVIARTFPLDEIAAAHRYLESNAQIGKVVVTTGAMEE
jgi:NADPH:quinone reductase-like Zn-dependent oxidoreductase